MQTELSAIDILTRRQKADPRWVERQNQGYNLREKDGDHVAALYYKDAFIDDFPQTTVDVQEVLKVADAHWKEITKPTTIRWCRHCIHWQDTYHWQGNCAVHSWEKDRWSQDAEAGECEDYRNKYELKEAICQSQYQKTK